MGLLTLPPRMDILVPMTQSSERRPTGVGKLQSTHEDPGFQTTPVLGTREPCPRAPLWAGPSILHAYREETGLPPRGSPMPTAPQNFGGSQG